MLVMKIMTALGTCGLRRIRAQKDESAVVALSEKEDV
jgi:hypothetical protein